jgi:hypothetical protein
LIDFVLALNTKALFFNSQYKVISLGFKANAFTNRSNHVKVEIILLPKKRATILNIYSIAIDLRSKKTTLPGHFTLIGNDYENEVKYKKRGKIKIAIRKREKGKATPKNGKGPEQQQQQQKGKKQNKCL